MKYLMRKGADPNLLDKNGETASLSSLVGWEDDGPFGLAGWA